MSIIAYVGLPGSGKSYDVVENQILPALKNNRRVVTNIPLDRDAIRRDVPGGEIVELPLDLIAQSPERIDEYATGGSVVVIDECWRLWPTGLKADKVPQPFKSLLAEHRHKVDAKGNAMQIVFVTQDLAQLAAFARQLVEQTFHHTKLAHLGMRGTYRIDVFHGAVTGAVPPVNNRLRESFGKYSPKVFKYYKSHTMSDSAKSGANERPIDTRGNALMKPWLIGGGALLVVGAIVWAVPTVYSLATGGRAEASVASPTGPRASALSTEGVLAGSRALVAPFGAGTEKPAPLPAYRLAATLQRDNQTGVAWIDVGNGAPLQPIPLTDCVQPYGDFPHVWECAYAGVLVSLTGTRARPKSFEETAQARVNAVISGRGTP